MDAGSARPPGRGARWTAWALAAVLLLPAAALGERTAREVLKEQRDHRLWKEVGGCQGAERYLKAFPKGLNADEARRCLEAEKEEKEERRRRMKGYEEGAYRALERGNVAGARRRLEKLRELDEEAPAVMDLEDAIAEAEEKLGTMREYAETGREALGRGDLEKARRYVERLRGLDAESPLAVELEEAVAEAERDKAKEEERRRAEAERKAKEAEERRLAEAERKRKAEAEEAARRARAEPERKRKAKEAEERRLAEARRKKPGDTFRDCPECPEMVVVREGRFRMGSTAGHDDELPVHEVTIARQFAVGVNEVTRGEFARFVSATGRSMGNACWTYEGGEWKERSGRHWRSPGFSQTDSHPVVCVSWSDAKAYVRWLSRETGEAYRLLSEAEWEYVARAGTTTAYWWGNGIGRSRANCGDGCGDSYRYTAPVGSFSANPFGLYDMHGNVWEWVEDCWNGSYRGAPSDGSAWTSGDCARRVLRGGSWHFSPRGLRSAIRFRYSTGNRDSHAGFRVARTLTP